MQKKKHFIQLKMLMMLKKVESLEYKSTFPVNFPTPGSASRVTRHRIMKN